jgi:plasmid stabilization system protein ParE
MLRLHRRANEEIREAARWYEERSIGLGARFVAAVRDVFENLEARPQQFAQLETVSADTAIRRVLVSDFPYLVVFELFDAEVFVYAVAHASRRPNYWRRRKRQDSERRGS